MTDQGRRCPNGHPALFSGEGFCEVCGAPLGAAAAPPPGWGQQPMPPQQPVPPAWGQQAPPPGWGQPQQPMPQQPGWGAPPPQQGWAPQGQPAWGAPPPKKGGGCGRTILILLLLAIIGFAGYLLVAKPSWSPLAAKSSASPGLSLPTAKPSGPASSKTPAPLISIEPGGSGLPTAKPTTGATAAAGDLKSCRIEKIGVTVNYPSNYQTTDDPDLACQLFDTSPITILPNTELPQVGFEVLSSEEVYSAVVSDFTENSEMWELLDSQTGSVDGLDATAIYVRATGNGLVAKDMESLVVAVDRGSYGSTLILMVTGTPGPTFDANAEALGTVISNLKIDR